MDLQAFWFENKSFLRDLGLGTVVYLGLAWQAQGMAVNARDLATRNSRLAENLREEELRLEGAEGLEKGRAQALGEQAQPQTVDALVWRLEPTYAADEKASNPYLDFTKSRRLATDAIKRAAAFNNTALPQTFGFLDKDDPEALAAHRMRLDVTASILTAMMTPQTPAVIEVKAVAQLEPKYSKLPFETEQGGILEQLPTSFDLMVIPERVAPILASFQVLGRFLEVLDFDIQRVPRQNGPVRLNLTVQALRILKQAPAGARLDTGPISTGPTGPKPPSRPLRRFGGGR